MEQIKINSGIYQCEIVDENNRVLGILAFNPVDFNLPDRLSKGWKNIQNCLEQARDTISKHTEELEALKDDTVEIDNKDMETLAGVIADIDRDIKEQLDYIFDADLSSVFGNTHLATPTKTGFLIENLMNALMPVIEREIKKANANSQAKKSKYTKRYQ